MTELTKNGNNSNLDEVLGFAKEVAETIADADKAAAHWKHFEKIVKGVSRKYASIYVDREDLEQELWLVVIDRVNDAGGAENADPRFIAKCCYNKAVDFYRYSRRRKDSSARLIEEAESGEDSDSELGINYCKFESGYDKVIIHEVIDLFPIGSRERKYVVTKLYMYGEISEKDGLPDELELPEGDTEADVLKLLGYNSRYPSSWGKLKYQIRDKIYRYLGIISEDECSDEASVKSTILSRVEELVISSRKGYLDFNRILRDKALVLLGCDEATILEVIGESKRILKSVGPNGDWWALKNDDRIAKEYFIDYGYKVFRNE